MVLDGAEGPANAIYSVIQCSNLIGNVRLELNNQHYYSMFEDNTQATAVAVNFYMRLLAKHVNDQQAIKVHCMSYDFWDDYPQLGYYTAVEPICREYDSPLKNDDVGEILVLLPHAQGHGIGYINLTGKIINYYGYTQTDEQIELQTLLEFMKRDHAYVKEPFEMNSWKLTNVTETENLPYDNGNDSAIYVCMYANALLRKLPMSFTSEHVNYFKMRIAYEMSRGCVLQSGGYEN